MSLVSYILKNKKVLIVMLVSVFVIGIASLVYFNEKSKEEVDISSYDVGNLDISASASVDSQGKDATNNQDAANSGYKEIYIHVIGEVNAPNIYKLKEGQRIVDAIEAAGGVTEKADLSKVNLAYVITDGEQVRIPSVDDKDENPVIITSESGDGKNSGVINNNYAGSQASNSKVNINTASQSELETIDGVGPSIAARIIEYRKKNGGFKSVDELKEVSGIGNEKFERMKGQVLVK